MSNKKEMELLVNKLCELKSLFEIGEKVIPGIQRLVEFMHEIVPTLNNINNSIEESNSKIPKATDHISDVTNATELATTEILDLVDEISNNIVNVQNLISEVVTHEKNSIKLLDELAQTVSENKRATELVAKLTEEIKLNGLKNNISQFIDQIKNDSNNITIALQVQDITSQQLAAVNHLIKSVQKKLSSLMFDLTGESILKVNKSSEVDLPSEETFDMDASYTKGKSSQEEIDLIIESEKKTSQGDIDKLFG